MFEAAQLAAWCGGRWTFRPAAPITRVVHDSRHVGPGALFVAVAGARDDGHRFVADAFARGAVAALVRADSEPARRPPGPLLLVGDTRRALTDLARGHRARWRGHVIGVTGSVGKTTAKDLAAALLAPLGPVAGTIGNWNNDVGLPLSMLAADAAAAWAVFEVGMNHPGELAPLCNLLKPHWAILTRIGPVHIEFFENEEAIACEKATLLRALPPNGLAILAPDEPWYDLLRASAPCHLVTAGLTEAADYVGRRDPVDPVRLLVRGPRGLSLDVRLPLRGEAFARTALRAIAVAAEAGAPPEKIARRLEQFRPPPMRGGEETIGGVIWINDAYNANPISVFAALQALAEHPSPRRWVVLGAMRELGRHSAAYHAAAGREAACGPWEGIVIVGPEAAPVADGAVSAGWPVARLARCRTPEEAAEWLRPRLAQGDAVLVKASRGERLERVIEAWAARTGPGKEAGG